MIKTMTLGFAAMALFLSAPTSTAPKAQSTVPVQVAAGRNNCPVYYGCPVPVPAPAPAPGGGGGKGGEPQAPTFTTHTA